MVKRAKGNKCGEKKENPGERVKRRVAVIEDGPGLLR